MKPVTDMDVLRLLPAEDTAKMRLGDANVLLLILDVS